MPDESRPLRTVSSAFQLTGIPGTDAIMVFFLPRRVPLSNPAAPCDTPHWRSHWPSGSARAGRPASHRHDPVRWPNRTAGYRHLTAPPASTTRRIRNRGDRGPDPSSDQYLRRRMRAPVRCAPHAGRTCSRKASHLSIHVVFDRALQDMAHFAMPARAVDTPEARSLSRSTMTSWSRKHVDRRDRPVPAYLTSI